MAQCSTRNHTAMCVCVEQFLSSLFLVSAGHIEHPSAHNTAHNTGYDLSSLHTGWNFGDTDHWPTKFGNAVLPLHVETTSAVRQTVIT